MTTEEFENEFDVLYNNIMSNQAPGLDVYEKSVFLTRGQDEILKAYFYPQSNKLMQGFDANERRQIDFSKQVSNFFPLVTPGAGNIDKRSSGVAKSLMPQDALMILNEVVDVNRENKNVTLQVVPLSYKEYSRLMSKPHKRPLKWQAWRLQVMELVNSSVDLIAGFKDVITAYRVRYVKRPTPIILGDLEGVSIEGISVRTECVLDPILHKEILQRAVELAKAAYTGDLTSSLALGQNSETNIGIIPTGRN